MNGNYRIKTDQSSVDIYTAAHLGFGYIARRYGWSVESILVAATLYELIEDQLIDALHSNRRIGWSRGPKHNALVDIIVAYAGAYLAEK